MLTVIPVEVLYTGICASDLHTLSSGWGDMSSLYPMVVGHEIVGKAIRVGDAVKSGIKVGDIVGCGAQCDSCQECTQCEARESNLLPLQPWPMPMNMGRRRKLLQQRYGRYLRW